MLKKTLSVALLGSALLFAGCQSTPSSSAAEVNNLQMLQNRTWIATQIGAQNIKTNPSAHNIPALQFDEATKRVSGADGCNRLMGTYQATGNTLVLSQMASTKMACIDNTLPNQFNTALANVTNYQVYNNTLKLLDRNGNLLVEFTRAKQPR
ncbi:META domain-containing protein [Acinetobacter tibetensis]|uniref:META domain-containing protein n=1 Tax=Acinetobacter tibetensis TaxID=2943497 RepID=A0AAE9LQE6_9GAMM|nr:META domain-containing protein [Acinetobacter tibetensis]USE82845.1 META domain-containing protein [Acinetobacter tibetensis]